MASIWWEAGYQQGRKEKQQSSCNDIRKVIAQDPDYSDELLPNCNSNGQWLVSRKLMVTLGFTRETLLGPIFYFKMQQNRKRLFRW